MIESEIAIHLNLHLIFPYVILIKQSFRFK